MLEYLVGRGNSQVIFIWPNSETTTKKMYMSLFNMFQPTLDTKLSYTYHKNLRGKSVMVLLPMSEQHQNLVDRRSLISVCKNKKSSCLHSLAVE